MATLTEYLDYEQQKPASEVRLYAEGLFYKAYEQSAYYLATECGLKPVKRWSKQLQRDYVTAGFPKTSLGKFLPQAVVDGKGCYYSDPEWAMRHGVVQIDMDIWKADLPLHIPAPKTSAPQTDRAGAPPAEPRPAWGTPDIPAFKMMYEVLLRFIQQSGHLTRDYRYTIGEDIKRKMIDTEVVICRAHTTRDKTACMAYIDNAQDNILEIKLLLRVLHDCKQLNTKRYALTVEAIVGVEKQLQKWKEYQRETSPNPSKGGELGDDALGDDAARVVIRR